MASESQLDPAELISAQAEARVRRWVSENATIPRPRNAPDIHLESLVTLDDPFKIPDAALRLFLTAIACPYNRTDIQLQLIIPLRTSSNLKFCAPDWNEISRDLGSTTPSIYAIYTGDLLVPFSCERYTRSLSLPNLLSTAEAAASYHCWRKLEDEEDDGWARDIRIEHIWAPDLGARSARA